ncbi:MAG: M20/M25/M40 family metallo-hydrolase, partial [Thermodesulfobacteriota bacterium]|nr:M20/M25/M40 family metallo-hydrolase [Thermodesulfobacteriota bacterium]
MSINPDRLASTFISLCEIDSPARKEGRLANHLKKLFSLMGADEIIEDESAALTGSDCGNLIIRFKGRGLPLEPIFFNCHMDVISPCDGVKVRFKNGLFSSRGETVLGGDDKGGLAILIEAMQTLLDNEVPFGPVEFLFTTCEEVGLLGAKAFDAALLSSKIGYSLDSTGIDVVITGAPAAKYVVAKIFGLAAHAGLHPEQGISAIQIAAQAVGKLQLGLLDDESTANIGLISGGTATNIIPDYVELRGEV